jgi:misacylated tRNA(Ala) deacylase
MRLHTALHVMSCVVVAPVSGGNIAPDKARLDFDIDMNLLNAERIEQGTNALTSAATEPRRCGSRMKSSTHGRKLVKTMSVQPPRGAGACGC